MYPGTIPMPSSGPTHTRVWLGPVHSGHRSGGGLAGGVAFMSIPGGLTSRGADPPQSAQPYTHHHRKLEMSWKLPRRRADECSDTAPVPRTGICPRISSAGAVCTSAQPVLSPKWHDPGHSHAVHRPRGHRSDRRHYLRDAGARSREGSRSRLDERAMARRISCDEPAVERQPPGALLPYCGNWSAACFVGLCASSSWVSAEWPRRRRG